MVGRQNVAIQATADCRQHAGELANQRHRFQIDGFVVAGRRGLLVRTAETQGQTHLSQ
ncbi:Uncharacterised protein [Serratia quinivorans]|nr:Uncharacterised protein [Serratia quinivorans]